MVRPSAEKRQSVSFPGDAVRRLAVPPLRGTSQMSPAKLKQMSVALSAGARSSSGWSPCATSGETTGAAVASRTAAAPARRNDME
jgi:hypothetical protein